MSINGQGRYSNLVSVTLPAATCAAPLGLAATAGNKIVTLCWIVPPDPPGHPVKSYDIYRSTVPIQAGATPVVTSCPTPGANAVVATYTDTDQSLVNGASNYYYKIAAVNDAGEGPLSEQASAQPANPTVLLPAPARTKAIAMQPTVVLTWSAVTAASYYNIYRSVSPGQPVLYKTHAPLTLPGSSSPDPDALKTYSWTELSPIKGTAYSYQIAAVGTHGQGWLSYVLNATPGSTPAAAPTELIPASGHNWVTVSWLYGGAPTNYYNVYRSTKQGAEGSDGDVPFTTGPFATGYGIPDAHGRRTFSDTNVTTGTTYHYRIAMVDSGGQGNLSADTIELGEVEATPGGALLPAPELVASPGNGTITLSWTRIPGALYYLLYKLNLDPGEPLSDGVRPIQTGNTSTDVGLINAHTYGYQVEAVNATGGGGVSAIARATPAAVVSPLPPPAAAATSTGPNLTGAGPTVTVSWTPVIGAYGYYLYRDDVGPVGFTCGLTQLTDSFNVVAGTTHAYSIAAFTQYGGEGVLSGTVSAMPNNHVGAGVALNQWYSGTNCNPGTTATFTLIPGATYSAVLASLTTSVNRQAFLPDAAPKNAQPGDFANTPFAPPHVFASGNFNDGAPVAIEADAMDTLKEKAVATGAGNVYNEAYVLTNSAGWLGTILANSQLNTVEGWMRDPNLNYIATGGEQDSKPTILATLPNKTAFYIASHSNQGCVGDCFAGVDADYVPTGAGVLYANRDPTGGTTIAAAISNKYQPGNERPPYTFVWIDACRASRDTTLASAFGIGTNSVDAAFLGYTNYLLMTTPTGNWEAFFWQSVDDGVTVYNSVRAAYRNRFGWIPQGAVSIPGSVVDAVATVYGDNNTRLGKYVYLGTGNGWFR